jgi:hypothetical protein
VTIVENKDMFICSQNFPYFNVEFGTLSGNASLQSIHLACMFLDNVTKCAYDKKVKYIAHEILNSEM